MSKPGSISVIIPGFIKNEAENTLPALLTSIHNGLTRFPQILKSIPIQEILIIDDCSPIDLGLRSGAWQTDFGSLGIDVQVLRLAKKSFSSGARNFGAQSAASDWIWFLDADIEFTTAFWQFLAEMDPDLRNLLRENDGLQFFYDIPSLVRSVPADFKQSWIHWNYKNLAGKQINWVFSACYLMKRQLLLDFGGYVAGSRSRDASDEVFIVDRLDEAGYLGRVVGAPGIEHNKNFSLRQLLANDFSRAVCQFSFMFQRIRRTLFKRPAKIHRTKIRYHISWAVILSLAAGLGFWYWLLALGAGLLWEQELTSFNWWLPAVSIWLALNRQVLTVKRPGLSQQVRYTLGALLLVPVTYLNFSAAIVWSLVRFPFRRVS